MIQSKGVVVLSAFSRDVLLDQCLESIYSADHSSSVRKLITHQSGYSEVSKIILKYEDALTSVLRVDGLGRTKLQNINFNYWNGFTVAFGTYKADWVLCVEEDSILSSDIFSFIDNIYGRYNKERFFRGINLGSLEVDTALIGSYSLQRYGFHGQSGVITKRSWNTLNRIGVGSKIKEFPFDSATEKYWKTGYMITPNLTKSLNFGWIDGTHVSSNPNQEHFLEMRKSWEKSIPTSTYRLIQVQHKWGTSTKPYRPCEQLQNYALFFLGLILDRKWYFNFIKCLRNAKRIILCRDII